MQKIFTIFLLAVMMCVSACGCSDAPVSLESAPTIFGTEIEGVRPAVATPLSVDNTNASEMVVPTKSEAEIMYYTEDEVAMVAKVLQRECGGLHSVTEQACVAWVICNRVDSDEFGGDTITEIVTAPYQFAYYYDTPVTDELYDLALDVLSRWNAERNGKVPDGRVLPKDYTYFTGDGVHNYFRDRYKGSYSVWDYSLPSPYES